MGRSSGGGSSGGRSGGGSSGRSNGGFGGSRSSGGFSGGGRSSGNVGKRTSPFNTAPSHRNTYRPPRRQTIYIPTSTHVPRNTGHTSSYVPLPAGGTFWKVLTGVLILFLLLAFIIPKPGNTNSGIINTKQREALSGQVRKTDWYEDGIGWISNRLVLIEGLEYFYNKTGVQPYVMLIPYDPSYWNPDGSINPTTSDSYLSQMYSEIFTDEAHFIFAYFQSKNDMKSELEGEFRYTSGYSTDTIMDSEAIKIFWGYFNNNYYDTSLSIEEMIGDAFASTANLIMSKPTNSNDVIIIILLIVFGLILLGALLFIVISVMKHQKSKLEYQKKILETPLETFSEAEDTSDLEKKYDK